MAVITGAMGPPGSDCTCEGYRTLTHSIHGRQANSMCITLGRQKYVLKHDLMTSQQDQKVTKVYLESKVIQEFLDIKDLEDYLVIKG